MTHKKVVITTFFGADFLRANAVPCHEVYSGGGGRWALVKGLLALAWIVLCALFHKSRLDKPTLVECSCQENDKTQKAKYGPPQDRKEDN